MRKHELYEYDGDGNKGNEMSTLERLKELEAKATPAPWFWMQPDEKQSSDIGYYEPYTDDSSGPGFEFAVIERDSGVYPPDVSTGDLIIEMRNALPKLLAVFEVIEGHDIDNLLKKIDYLKQTDGEGWAVGEMLRRALEL